MLKWISALLDRICVVVGALIFAQIPLFIQQYMQQLTGREAELQQQISAMRRAAGLSGKTLEQFIQKFLTSTDADFYRQGELMQAMFQRWESFHESLSALQSSTVYAKPIVFLRYLNLDAFKSTYEHFSFGIPLNVEGLLYAVAGIIFGYIVFMACRGFCRLFYKPKSAPAHS